MNDDFIQWKQHPVTREVFRLWQHRHDELMERLIVQSTYMPEREQAETFAAIKVYREILVMSPEDTDDN